MLTDEQRSWKGLVLLETIFILLFLNFLGWTVYGKYLNILFVIWIASLFGVLIYILIKKNKIYKKQVGKTTIDFDGIYFLITLIVTIFITFFLKSEKVVSNLLIVINLITIIYFKLSTKYFLKTWNKEVYK